jgi:hypothetical protein
MRTLPSSVLFVILVFAGAVAVIANALYPVAKAQEAKERLARDARTILLPELDRNATLLASIQTDLAKGTIPPRMFDVTAWETISKGGLLLGLDPDEIRGFLDIYRLAYQANQLIAQLLGFSTGIESALGNAAKSREIYAANLEDTLNSLKAALASSAHTEATQTTLDLGGKAGRLMTRGH